MFISPERFAFIGLGVGRRMSVFIGFARAHLAVLTFGRWMVVSPMRFAFLGFMALAMGGRMLVFRKGFSFGDVMGFGMSRRLMRVGRALLRIGRNFFDDFGSPVMVMNVLLFVTRVIFVGIDFRFMARVAIIMAVDDASLNNKTGSKQEQHDHPCRIFKRY